MFLDNKYTKIYHQLMERGKNRHQLNEEYEIHHILPLSLGGKKTRDNEVKLTLREHFIAHCLLVKMCIKDRHKRSMAYAFHSMKNSRKGLVRVTNSRLYDLIKQSTRKYMVGANNHMFGVSLCGENNGFYGKIPTKEHKKKLSESMKLWHKMNDNPFLGKNHTIETKKMISKKRTIPILVEYLDGNLVCYIKREYLGLDLGMSVHTGCALCKPQHAHRLKKYGIKSITPLGSLYEISQMSKAG